MSDVRSWPTEPEPGQDLLLDSGSLRALTHPVRVRMLNLLRSEGPSTATKLAARLGLNSGATSYHLRRLESGGFIVEDTGRGDGRDRWWRAAHRSTWYDPAAAPPEDQEASAAYLRAVAMMYGEQMQRAVDEYPALPEEWRRSWTLSHYRLRLTPAESERMLEELLAVIGRYRMDEQPTGQDGAAGRGDADADVPDGAGHVVLQLQSFVLPGPGGQDAG
jgi:DNA-binding transcriptional ArsR family regulator